MHVRLARGQGTQLHDGRPVLRLRDRGEGPADGVHERGDERVQEARLARLEGIEGIDHRGDWDDVNRIDHLRRRIFLFLRLLWLLGRLGRARPVLAPAQAAHDVALGIVGRPELLFLDEPTTGFDPEARRQFWALIRSLRELGTTMLLTTHYLDEAEALCDRVAIMDRGRVLELDTPAALVRGLDAPVHIYVAPHEVTLEQARALPGVETAEDDGTAVVLTTHRPSEVLTRLAELEALEGLQVRAATLEDVFLDLTGREYRA